MIIGVLALAVILLLVDKIFLSTDVGGVDVATAEIEKSLAVLPFADLSQAQDQEWFADGLAEEILNALARTPDLLISARTSTFAYKGSDKDIPTIAQELGVAHVLEGSVRRSGDRIRVTAQLIRANDGFHLWSQNYDRDSTDIIEIQEDLAIQIASALETTMDPGALADMLRVGTSSVAAYQAYIHGAGLRSRSLLENRNDLMRTSYEFFEEARKQDPTFSAAKATGLRSCR
jgi:TolB-like protein